MAKNFEPRLCVICGKEFTPTRENMVCCSKKCSGKRWRTMKALDNKFVREEKVCIICGKLFLPLSSKHLCCSKECTLKRNKQVNAVTQKQKYAEEKAKRKAREAMPKSNHDKIADIAIEAREHGMTYGQYVAKMGLK